MKKKTLMIIVCATATVILVSALCIASLTGGSTADAPEKEIASSDVGVIIDGPETEIAVASVVEDETVDETETEPDVQPDDGSVLTIPDEDEPEPAQPDHDAGKSAGAAAFPIVELTPPDDGDGGGIVIGETQAVYNCGLPGHHCEDRKHTPTYLILKLRAARTAEDISARVFTPLTIGATPAIPLACVRNTT